jgi:hypothetical protein
MSSDSSRVQSRMNSRRPRDGGNTAALAPAPTPARPAEPPPPSHRAEPNDAALVHLTPPPATAPPPHAPAASTTSTQVAGVANVCADATTNNCSTSNQTTEATPPPPSSATLANLAGSVREAGVATVLINEFLPSHIGSSDGLPPSVRLNAGMSYAQVAARRQARRSTSDASSSGMDSDADFAVSPFISSLPTRLDDRYGQVTFHVAIRRPPPPC